MPPVSLAHGIGWQSRPSILISDSDFKPCLQLLPLFVLQGVMVLYITCWKISRWTQSFTLLCIRMEAQKHYEHSYNSWCWNKSYWGWVELWQEDCFSFSFLALLKKSPCCACLLEAVFVKLWGNCVVRRMFIITKKIYTFMSGNLSLVHAEMCVIFGLQTTWIFY